ncbi:ABC transporter ATP-binding protein [Streptomyces sp. CB03911]|uniref:ATP-binding cassette domain-containing protein n=1 Tax=Streptomyces sp. CB03911 TaxID=1804758 RepID=UPI000963E481|nr:ABC transporter ATP-binding protein [Streptomyces sp. CB03911]OKI12778.1 hypothetical protein A6A07_18195 [Streptomyces sp. CB03911]
MTQPSAKQDHQPDQGDADKPGEKHTEEFRARIVGDKRVQAGESISTGAVLRRMPQLIRRALALAWAADARSTLLLLVCQVASGISGALALYFTTGTLDALLVPGPVTDHLADAAPYLGVLAAAAALRAVLGIAVTALAGRVAPRINREADLALIAAGCAAELTAYDEPAFNERWESADRGAATTPDLLTNAQDVIASTISLLAAASVLATLHPWLVPFLVLGSVPTGIAAVRTARIHYLASVTTGEERIALRIYRWYLMDKGRADQVRSDQVTPFMMGKYREVEARIAAATDRATGDAARISLVAALGTGAGSALIFGTLLFLVSTGRIDLAAAGAATFGLRTAASGVQGMVGNGARLYRMGLYLDDYFAFLDEAGGYRIRRGSAVPEAPTTIEVNNLSYVYPGEQQEPALRGVSLTLRAGEVVAVIGQNGSGKSTLLKLLGGLYLPQPGAGTLTWDGVPIEDLDAEGLWSRVARVPQEFARWPVLASENLHLGHHDGDQPGRRRRGRRRTHRLRRNRGAPALGLAHPAGTGLARRRGTVRRRMAACRGRPRLLPHRTPPGPADPGRADLRPRPPGGAQDPPRPARLRTRPDHPAGHAQSGQRPARGPHRRHGRGPHRAGRHLARPRRPARRPVPGTPGPPARPGAPRPAGRRRVGGERGADLTARSAPLSGPATVTTAKPTSMKAATTDMASTTARTRTARRPASRPFARAASGRARTLVDRRAPAGRSSPRSRPHAPAVPTGPPSNVRAYASWSPSPRCYQ